MAIILIYILSLILPLYSQDMTLDIEKAWKMAIENNQGLKAKEFEKNQAEYAYLNSLNLYLPQISLTHSFSRSGGDNLLTSNKFSAQALLEQNIFNLKTISSIKIARLNYESAQVAYETALCELRKNLYSAYMNLYFSQKAIEVNSRIVEIRKENASLIKLKYESGLESKGNMLYAQAQYEMAKLNLKKAQRQLENYMDILAQTIGIKRNGNITVTGNFDIPSFEIDINKISDYLSSYPDIKSYLKNLEIAKEKLYSAKSDLYPSLKFSSLLGYSGKSEFPDNKNWSMSLSLNFPLFSGGPTYYTSNKSSMENALKSAEKKLEEAIFSFEKDLKNAWNDFLNARDTAITYKTLMEANEERYKEGQIQYMAGKMNFIDLENLEQAMIDSRLNNLEYIKNAHLKKIALERLLGIKK